MSETPALVAAAAHVPRRLAGVFAALDEAGVRWSLLKAPENQTVRQLAALHEVQHANRRLYRAFLLKEQLRLL